MKKKSHIIYISIITILLFVILSICKIKDYSISNINIKYQDGVRDVLEGIYFISASIVPIVIGYFTLIIAKRAGDITKNQLELSKALHKPRFLFTIKFIKDTSGMVLRDHLNIVNQNSEATVVEKFVKNVTFLVVNKINDHELTTGKFIPITGYYFYSPGNLQNHSGKELQSTNDENNFEYFAKLVREFNNYSDVEKLYLKLEVRRYIYIVYEDKFNEMHKEYYYVNEYGGHRVLGEHLDFLKNKIDKTASSEDFFNLTLERLIEIYNTERKE